MKKTLILLLLFIMFGLGAMMYLKDNKGTKGTEGAEFEKMFAIDDAEEIHKIFLADRKGNTNTLTRNGPGEDWIYDGKYKARPGAIRNLLDAMTRIRVKFRPASAATEFLVENLSTGGIKVEAYNKAGEKLKAYYVGGSSQDDYGTTVIMEGSDEPLIAHIPNWIGTIYNRYSINGIDWRHKGIFEEDPDDIQSVKIDYPGPELNVNSFVLNRISSRKFTVEPLYATTPILEKPVQAGKVEAFLVEFEKKIAEAFRNDHTDKENLIKQLPFCEITMVKKDGTEKRVKFFPIFPEDAQIGKEEYGLVATNRPVFRYFADVNGDDFMLVQQRVFGEIFWGYSRFF